MTDVQAELIAVTIFLVTLLVGLYKLAIHDMNQPDNPYIHDVELREEYEDSEVTYQEIINRQQEIIDSLNEDIKRGKL